jgi:hypothetical protein
MGLVLSNGWGMNQEPDVHVQMCKERHLKTSALHPQVAWSWFCLNSLSLGSQRIGVPFLGTVLVDILQHVWFATLWWNDCHAAPHVHR